MWQFCQASCFDVRNWKTMAVDSEGIVQVNKGILTVDNEMGASIKLLPLIRLQFVEAQSMSYHSCHRHYIECPALSRLPIVFLPLYWLVSTDPRSHLLSHQLSVSSPSIQIIQKYFRHSHDSVSWLTVTMGNMTRSDHKRIHYLQINSDSPDFDCCGVGLIVVFPNVTFRFVSIVKIKFKGGLFM